MTSFKRILVLISGIPFVFSSFSSRAQDKAPRAHYPDWAKNAVIYEVNVRQHSLEGNFVGVEKDLPRLKSLGVDILWLMPIHPIGEKNRKGKLGSYYSVKDYKAVNPDYGSDKDFQSLVDNAHRLGFKVIIDWVANHSAWDNAWMTEHPDWYQKDSTGKFLSPYDWTDVVSFNYKNPAMRLGMINVMKYWVERFQIDGFRCDVAGLVPADFWEQARKDLQNRKTLFMLAEDEANYKLYKKAFDMSYGWNMHALLSKVTKGEIGADSILKLQKANDAMYPNNGIKMNFTTNHDENSWNGTVKEKFGEGGRACAVLTYTMSGMPLIYSGQEAGLDKRLRFFDKDTIDWSNKALIPFYQALNKLKHEHEALWNPPFGGKMTVFGNNIPKKVISFSREKGSDKVFVIANLSAVAVKVVLGKDTKSGKFTDIFNNKAMLISPGGTVELGPWEYKVGVVSK
ncbi:MAG: alpha-amylase family glycosyl hydrolase [Bacteroidota bacterium]